MSHIWFDSSSESRRRIAQKNLKCCPLCDTLNSTSNRECFVCGWHGKFESDPTLLESSLIRMLTDIPDLGATHTPSIFHRLFRKRTDFTA
ncbi:MAG: hypothetical protein ABL949_12670 [Fimbriimonadaceae bacterium]